MVSPLDADSKQSLDTDSQVICRLLSYILYFSIISILFWLSCVSFGIRANIDLSDLKHPAVNPKLEKITTKKKKKKNPSPSCFLHQRVVFVIFSTWSKKVSIQLCFPVPKKKKRPTQDPSLTSRQNP